MIYKSVEGLWIVDESVVQHPAEVLLTPTIEVREFTEQLRSLAGLMFDSMRKHRGMGLAANQIGVGLRLAVMHVPGWPEIVMVNPRITKRRGGDGVAQEGCLSVKRSGHWVPVRRSKIVHVEWCGLNGPGGGLSQTKAAGLLGRCIQHELDHLDGLTCLERSRDHA